ncbi:MAG: serine/threonine protein kinase [Comamonadaceae bacterium]|nr:MAG: serine/threonine protein kinase [Comamonadaceae bacterium]
MNTVPGYQTEAVLGRGRASVVVRAHDIRQGRKVALKLARRTPLAAAAAAPDFSAEFAAASALAHRHVLQVFAHGVAGDDAWLSMELANGSLAAQPAALRAARAGQWLREAAMALAQLHRQGWVHRDVKPANLLLRADGSLALADFGCARPRGTIDPRPHGSAAGAAGAFAVVGTPRYAAPEQSQGAPAQSPADVYSLGAVLYEMLCGQPLFPGETLTELFCQHQLATVPRLPDPHGAWQPLIDAMLDKDPRGRPCDGNALLAELQRTATRGLA